MPIPFLTGLPTAAPACFSAAFSADASVAVPERWEVVFLQCEEAGLCIERMELVDEIDYANSCLASNFENATKCTDITVASYARQSDVASTMTVALRPFTAAANRP